MLLSDQGWRPRPLPSAVVTLPSQTPGHALSPGIAGHTAIALRAHRRCSPGASPHRISGRSVPDQFFGPLVEPSPEFSEGVAALPGSLGLVG